MTSIIGSEIPIELWKEETFHMPICLVNSYEAVLQAHNLMSTALDTRNRDGIFGGPSREETLLHFALRYGVSTTRVESLVLDPASAFGRISSDLIATLSSGSISILDVPCGCGAAGVSLLTTIAALRANGLLPKLPLDVKITGGDCSTTGRSIYLQMVEKITPFLNSVGMGIELTAVNWDATNPDTTANMVDQWFEHSIGSPEYLVIVANFSGEAGSNFQQYSRSFQHIDERLHNKRSTLVWVEPQMLGARNFLERIQALFSRRQSDGGQLTHSYRWYQPLQRRVLYCDVLVYRYNRS